MASPARTEPRVDTARAVIDAAHDALRRVESIYPEDRRRPLVDARLELEVMLLGLDAIATDRGDDG
jgi:hypothetical protein